MKLLRVAKRLYQYRDHFEAFQSEQQFFDLSSEERAALENLSKRSDIIVKAANKGGALVVWPWQGTEFYQNEAL